MNLFGFRSYEWLAVHKAGKNESRANPVLFWRLELLEKDPLSTFGLEEGIILELRRAATAQQRISLLSIGSSLLRVASHGDDNVLEELAGNELLQLTGSLFIHSAFLPQFDQAAISLPDRPR